jgi:hypothetical protein
MAIIKYFPLLKFFFNINVISILNKLIKLLLIGSMRSLNFTIEVRTCRFNIDMPDTQIFAMPMELSLKFMPIAWRPLSVWMVWMRNGNRSST